MCGCFKDSVVAFLWGFFLLFVCVAMRVLKGSSIVRCLGTLLYRLSGGWLEEGEEAL
jgi:hypothetical protein